MTRQWNIRLGLDWMIMEIYLFSNLCLTIYAINLHVTLFAPRRKLDYLL